MKPIVSDSQIPLNDFCLCMVSQANIFRGIFWPSHCRQEGLREKGEAMGTKYSGKWIQGVPAYGWMWSSLTLCQQVLTVHPLYIHHPGGTARSKPWAQTPCKQSFLLSQGTWLSWKNILQDCTNTSAQSTVFLGIPSLNCLSYTLRRKGFLLRTLSIELGKRSLNGPVLSTVDLPAQPWHCARLRDTGRGCSSDGCWPSGPTDLERREDADVEEGNKKKWPKRKSARNRHRSEVKTLWWVHDFLL